MRTFLRCARNAHLAHPSCVSPAWHARAHGSQPTFLKELEKQPGTRKATLSALLANLESDRPRSMDECVTWARMRFEEFFNNTIQQVCLTALRAGARNGVRTLTPARPLTAQLLFNFPADMVTSSGTPFWSGTKRTPTPAIFSGSDPTHLDFVIAAANLRATMYGLTQSEDRDYFKRTAEAVMVPAFRPRSGVKINANENDNNGERRGCSCPRGGVADTLAVSWTPAEGDTTGLDEDAECERLEKALPKPSQLPGFQLSPIEFEKDDDTNYHVAFITACSNLRARNYDITEADALRTKQIAGKIIPAIATTTALVTGLVCFELIKLVEDKKEIEDYKNGFVNLALPFFGFSEPVPAPKMGESSFTLWDRFEVNEGRELTLKQFLEYFTTKHKLEVTMISFNVSMIYSFFTSADALQQRYKMTMSELAASISKQPLPSNSNWLTFEICCSDEEGEDVDVPSVKYRFRDF